MPLPTQIDTWAVVPLLDWVSAMRTNGEAILHRLNSTGLMYRNGA